MDVSALHRPHREIAKAREGLGDLDLGMYPPCGVLKEDVPLGDALGAAVAL